MIKSLIWNIRGIGSSPSVRRLKSLIRVHQLKLVCILEPFMSPAKLDATRVRLGMDSAFASESGKIWLFWSHPFHVQVLHDMGQVVHCRACHSSLSEGFFMSFVYAKCVACGMPCALLVVRWMVRGWLGEILMWFSSILK